MSDFKKSKKLDSSKSNQPTDLNNILQDIGEAEQESDDQIQTLETRMSEIKGLEAKLESVSEKLIQVEGDALQIAQREINQEIQQKESEAGECRNKLQEITEEMQEKQTEISEEIGKRDDALSELQTAEQECDVDLSESKDAVNSEKDTLEDANSRIEKLIGTINGVLVDNKPEKKTDTQIAWLENTLESTTQFVEQTNKLASNVLHNAIAAGKNLQVGLTMASALCSSGIVTYDEVISPVIDISNNVVAPLTSKNSVFSTFKEELDNSKKFHLGERTEEYEMLEVIKKKEEEERTKMNLNIDSSSYSSGSK